MQITVPNIYNLFTFNSIVLESGNRKSNDGLLCFRYCIAERPDPFDFDLDVVPGL